MTVGLYLIIILLLGYLSVYLRERYLQMKWLKPLTWLGIFIHESCHALFCLLTGGKVTGFRVTSTEGYITHYRPKVPVVGPMLTAIGPMVGGLIIMGVLNHFWLKTSLNISSANLWENFLAVGSNLNPFTWQAWVLLAIFLNIGVMVGPSIADLKSIWPLIILSFFVHSDSLAQILALIIVLIALNILLFLLILLIKRLLDKKKTTIIGRLAMLGKK